MGWKSIKEHYGIDHAVQVVPGKGICIGSPYVHDLLTITDSGEVIVGKLALRANDKLSHYKEEMDADPAKLRGLLSRADTFERSITVYTFEGSEIIECACEELGWPNVTHDGRMMYENTFSADRSEVVEWAKSNAAAGVDNWAYVVGEREHDLAEAKAHLERCRANLTALEAA